jgi:hypothetical protein
VTRDLRNDASAHPADRKFLADIEKYGWNVTNVFRKGDETGPEWAYSTGLFCSCEHPEIVIFGLELENMQKIINNIGSEVRRGARFDQGAEYHGIFARCACRFRPVEAIHYRDYLGWAIWFYEGGPFPVLQCFWPDREGRYPWDPGCDSSVSAAQPLLFKPA